MKETRLKTITIFAVLAMLMAATRFNHFGSAFSLPDASLAVFFLGGLYLARSVWVSVAAFVALALEAGFVDYYAISVQGVSDWCVTPAYGFLVSAYGILWLAGRWFALRHTLEAGSLARLGLTAWAAASCAFVTSSAAFYVFSGYFSGMSAGEYALSVMQQYYGSYIQAALLYIASAAGVQMALGAAQKQRARQQHGAA